MRPTRLLNYGLYQAGWLACILGAGWGQAGLGTTIALALLTIHVLWSREPLIELRLVVGAVAVGLVVEVVQIRMGTYVFQARALGPGLPPAWLLVLWAQFATTFRYSLRGIVTTPPYAYLFGALGGPLAFLAGDRLGALTLVDPVPSGLLRLALAWAFALLVCSAMTWRVCPPRAPQPTYRGL